MTNPLFIHGRLHAPFYIFLRDAGRYADTDLLRQFGLLTCRRTMSPPCFGPYAALADDGQWTMIVDDWYYTLWHMPSTRPTLAAFAAACDVFACSVGDCDRSFDFVYYRAGRLVRKYVVTDPDFRGGVVVENVGQPLEGESAAFRQPDEMSIVLSLAASLGIRSNYREQDVRVYSPNGPDGG